MPAWDMVAIKKRMAAAQKERDDQRAAAHERTLLVKEAREAMGKGGPEGLARWARERGVEVGSPLKAGQAKLAAESMKTMRRLAGLPKEGPKREELSEGSKALVRAVANELTGKGSVVERMRAQGLFEQAAFEALEEMKAKALRAKEKEEMEQKTYVGTLDMALGTISEMNALKMAAEKEARGPKASEPQEPPKRKILGKRGPG